MAEISVANVCSKNRGSDTKVEEVAKDLQFLRIQNAVVTECSSQNGYGSRSSSSSNDTVIQKTLDQVDIQEVQFEIRNSSHRNYSFDVFLLSLKTTRILFTRPDRFSKIASHVRIIVFLCNFLEFLFHFQRTKTLVNRNITRTGRLISTFRQTNLEIRIRLGYIEK